MHDFCCICGLVLGTHRSNFPQWCKDIRALCWIHPGRAVLSGTGSMDDDDMPFNLPVPAHGVSRYRFRRDKMAEDGEDCCYPFHTICWTILREVDVGNLLSGDVEPLFDIFDSAQYTKRTRYLNWGQDYLFEELLHAPRQSILAQNEEAFGTLDPSRCDIRPRASSARQPTAGWINYMPAFDFSKTFQGMSAFVIKLLHALGKRSFYILTTQTTSRANNGLLSLPTEVLESVVSRLDYEDVQRLFKASSYLCRTYGFDGCGLPASFWKSRFCVHGDTAFARSIRPSSCSYKDWFFLVRSEMRNGPNSLKIRNRMRIWKIGTDIISMVCSIRDPRRVLHGQVLAPPSRPPSRILGPTATAMKQDDGNCRELKQAFVSFENLSPAVFLCTLTPSYVLISKQRVVSGFSMELSNGASIDLGYVTSQHTEHGSLKSRAESVWLVCSQVGFEMITTVGRPQQNTQSSTCGKELATAKWPLKKLKGIHVGLDAMRVVRISIDTPMSPGLDGLLWTSAYPSSRPYLHEKDISSLRNFQQDSFAPASSIYIDPQNGRLVAIAVFSSLGRRAGITGIKLIYDTGMDQSWGSADDAASLAFFLGHTERLVRIRSYKMGSLVCHLEFITSLQRTSNTLPPLPNGSQLSMEYVDHTVSIGGSVEGFCGCYMSSQATSSPKPLQCFGVIGMGIQISSGSVCLPSKKLEGKELALQEMPLGGIKNHGEQNSQLFLADQYAAVQASINATESKYRRMGQVTGLLFRLNNNEGHPKLLGQWTGAGEVYRLEEGEQILDLDFTTTSPICSIPARPGLSQVESITLVTDMRKITWNPATAPAFEVEPTDQVMHKVTKVVWDFNAVFDRVKCSYIDLSP
ncbi:hypothetical protein BDZ45DRAFT_811261 [Acephala macrosclerotiorum]|nr:hypothetical protein BDZ45DRAFT_811261 [Acephala macrosclerotiorum]